MVHLNNSVLGKKTTGKQKKKFKEKYFNSKRSKIKNMQFKIKNKLKN